MNAINSVGFIVSLLVIVIVAGISRFILAREAAPTSPSTRLRFAPGGVAIAGISIDLDYATLPASWFNRRTNAATGESINSVLE